MVDQAFKIGRRGFLGGSAILAGAASAPSLGMASGKMLASTRRPQRPSSRYMVLRRALPS